MLSIASLVAAGIISIYTMTTHGREQAEAASRDPYQMAEVAASEGIEAAKWHIECHGRTAPGGIGRHYAINGASFEVSWGEVDLSDSTVTVKSSGISMLKNKVEYSLNIEKRVKLDFLPIRKNEILTDYYTRGTSMIVNVGAH